MLRLRQLFPRISTFADLNEKLVKYYGLPNGSKFALKRLGKATGTRPFMRADVEVRRKLLRREDHPRTEEVRVIDICNAVEAMLAPGSRTTVVAMEPNGQALNGNTTLRTWRQKQPRVTQEKRQAAEMRRFMVEELRQRAYGALRDLEEAVEDPRSDVPEAVIGALMDMYEVQSVRNAIQQLLL